MAELKGKKRKQPSSRPQGWQAAAVVVQLELTRRQEHYARRCVGISRFVYNRLVANDQAGRDTGLWLTPHELEKEFNAAKQVNPSLAFITQVSKFVAQGACRNYRNARSRWLNPEIKARRPVFHRKNRTGTGSFLAASGVACIQNDGHRRIRRRDGKGWRVFATTGMMDIPVVTERSLGVIGVDLNADHLAIAETDAFGNCIKAFSVPLVTYGQSTIGLRRSSATPWPAW